MNLCVWHNLRPALPKSCAQNPVPLGDALSRETICVVHTHMHTTARRAAGCAQHAHSTRAVSDTIISRLIAALSRGAIVTVRRKRQPGINYGAPPSRLHWWRRAAFGGAPRGTKPRVAQRPGQVRRKWRDQALFCYVSLMNGR